MNVLPELNHIVILKQSTYFKSEVYMYILCKEYISSEKYYFYNGNKKTGILHIFQIW